MNVIFWMRIVQSVQEKKLKCDFPLGARVRLYDVSNAFFALGEVVEAEDGLAIKAIKTFVLSV